MCALPEALWVLNPADSALAASYLQYAAKWNLNRTTWKETKQSPTLLAYPQFTGCSERTAVKMCAPYQQMEYSYVPLLYGMVLEVTVKSKNTFVAATNIKLEEELLDKETWFPLRNCAIWPQSVLHCVLAASRGCNHTAGRTPSKELSDWMSKTNSPVWRRCALSFIRILSDGN